MEREVREAYDRHLHQKDGEVVYFQQFRNSLLDDIIEKNIQEDKSHQKRNVVLVISLAVMSLCASAIIVTKQLCQKPKTD